MSTRWLPTALAILGVLAFATVMLYLGLRDRAAEERCRDLGGQTWDAGKHCVLGDPEVVTTR